MRFHIYHPGTSKREFESYNNKSNTPAPHSHLRPCNLKSHVTEEEKMATWAQFGYFYSGVYSHLLQYLFSFMQALH